VAAPSPGVSIGRRWLTPALLATTWIPIGFFLAAGSLGEPTGGVEKAKLTLLFLGGAHVPATLLLYTDRKFLEMARESPSRYVWAPLALMIASGSIFTMGGPTLQLLAYLVLWGWQTHHYGRQNVGVYAFAGLAGGWRALPSERRALDLAAACAVIGIFKILGTEIVPHALQDLFNVLYWIGALGFLGVVVFSVGVYLAHRRDFSLGRAVCFFTMVLFFLPLYLSYDVNIAFSSYAMAHGIQYLAFMAMVSFDLGREGRRAVSTRMIVVGASLVLLGLAGAHSADLKALGAMGSLGGVLDFLAGMSVGTTIAHFVVDAGAWRLSRPSARRYVTERFGFLFERGPARAPEAAAPAVSSR